MIFKIGSLNQKQTLAVASIVIGIILIVFAAHGMHKAADANSSINHFSDFFTNTTGIWNPVIKFFGGETHKKASKYDIVLNILMIVGSVMVVVGLWSVSYYKKRR
jgi:hypothetical protein